MTLPSAVCAEGSGRGLQLMAAMCLALVTVRARAEPDPIQLSWHAPSGCPRREDVRARIRKLAGDVRANGAPLVAAATIVRTADGRLHLKLVVRTDGAVGARELDANTCDDLAGATAVHLALLLRSAQPSAAELERPSEPRAEPAPSDVTPPPAVASTQAAPSTPNPEVNVTAPFERAAPSRRPEAGERAWRWLVQLPLVAASIGPLPRPSWSGALGAGVQLDGWRILASAGLWLSQTLRAENELAVSARVERIDVGLRACHALASARLELAPCAELSVQHIWARGGGAHVSAHTAEATWLGAGIGARARLTLTDWVGVVAGLDAQFQTARPRLSIEGAGRVQKLGPVAISFLVGSEWIL